MKFDYDKSADVMYLTLENVQPSDCRFVTNENQDILKIEKSTGNIVGVTILSFLLRINKGLEIEVPEIGAIPFKKQAAKILKTQRRA